MILMYHKVDQITPTQWWVTAQDLQRNINEIKDREFVYLDDYMDPSSQAVITFDDGYENLVHHAVAVLSHHSIPFEVFVCSDYIGGWNTYDKSEPLTRFMGHEHISYILKHGGRVQWHTRSHPDLTSLDDTRLIDELTVPRELRERYPSPNFNWLSYPYGLYNEIVMNLAKQKFKGAVAVLPEIPHGRWAVPRITVDSQTCLTPAYIDTV